MKKTVFLIFGLVLAIQMVAQDVLNNPYLVTDFNERSLETVLDACQKGGFEYLLVRTPFSTYGHYQWNPEFAANDKAVARMVQKAEEAGVHLGVMVQPEAISENDPYFSPKYSKHFLKEGKVELFSDITAEDCDLVLRRTDVIKGVSSLNLILVDNELISYGTIELAGDLLLLHRCTRGACDTRKAPHSAKAEAYKIWDSPKRCVAPDEYLLDSVRANLNRRIEATGIAFVLQEGAPGQELLDASVRLRQVERWTGDEGLKNQGCLGWINLHAADKNRTATSMEEVEWIMSKAVGFDAGYALLLDRKTLKKHGQLDEILETIKLWEAFRKADELDKTQLEALRDPYPDWHLELDGDHYKLSQWNISRRYHCNFVEADSLFIGAEPWEWKTDAAGAYGLRLQVDGKVPVVNPMINTEKGLLMFPCVIKPGQHLVYDLGELAYVMDENNKKLSEITVEGVADIPEGASEVRFYCETEKEGDRPQVTVRYITSSQMMSRDD